MKITMVAALVILLAQLSSAQTMTIHKNDHTTIAFPLSQIDSVSFSAQTAIPIDGLIAYYPFNGNANDQSGNGNNGTIWGATLTTDRFGKANSAFDFNGTSAYIQIPDAAILRPASISIAGWIYPRSSTGALVYKYVPGTFAGEQYAFVITASNYLHGGVKRNGSCAAGVGWLNAEYPQTVPTNQWMFVCLTWDGSVLNEYENGLLVATNANGPIGAIDACTGGPLYLGTSFNGKLDDFRFYSRALTSQEVLTLYGEQPQ